MCLAHNNSVKHVDRCVCMDGRILKLSLPVNERIIKTHSIVISSESDWTLSSTIRRMVLTWQAQHHMMNIQIVCQYLSMCVCVCACIAKNASV